MILSGQVIVDNTTGWLLVDGSGASSTTPVGATICNRGAVSVWLSGSPATPPGVGGGGYELAAGEAITLDLFAEQLFAVVATGAARVDVIRTRG